VWYGLLAIINTAIVAPNANEEMELRPVPAVRLTPSLRDRVSLVPAADPKVRSDRQLSEFDRSWRKLNPDKPVTNG